MGSDSCVAWNVYRGSDVVIDLKELQFDLSIIRLYMQEDRRDEYATVISMAKDVIENTVLPQHPTAMTPDELLDFAMRFVEK